jgi:virulence-associated protein VagC
MEKPAKTRVFRAGNSQAVRIPKALELPEGEVYIEPRDGGLFVSALRGRWDLFFAEAGVNFPFDGKDLRDNRSPREVRIHSLRAKPATERKAKPKHSR